MLSRSRPVAALAATAVLLLTSGAGAWNWDFDFDEAAIPPFELRPLHLDTPLVRAGKPAAVIAVRSGADHQVLAEQFNHRLMAASGVRLPVIDADAVTEAQLKSSHIVAFGNLCSNRVVARLYVLGFVVLDAARPGRSWRDDEGYVIHTVHDPFGYGTNIVVAGGSDFKGTQGAVSALCSRIAGGGDIVLPRLVDIRVGQTLMPYHAKAYAGLSAEALQAEVDKALSRASFSQGAVTVKLAQVAQDYVATGHDSYIALYKALMEAMIDYLISGKRFFDGGHLDFAVGPMTQGWDAVEEHPLFSDEERLRYAKVHCLLARELRQLRLVVSDILGEPDSLRQNHPTAGGLSLLTAGLYFERYGLAEARDWVSVGDICFAPQMHAGKGNEDSYGYNRIVPEHVREYCFRRGRMTYFEEGHDRRYAEECLLLADNLGMGPRFGDGSAGAAVDTGVVPALNFWAWYYNDGRYKWLFQKLLESRIGTQTFKPNRILGFNNPVVPVQPVDLCGIRIVPLDQAKYRWLRDNERAQRQRRGAPMGAPFERAFDKIVFRESLDRDGQYLCLDGFSYAYHGHLDGNSFPEFSDNGRLFLIDNTYNYQPGPDYHNGVAVTKDGVLARIPVCAGLEVRADFENWGFVQTLLPDYGDADWQRSVLWHKGRCFLVLDRVTARGPGDYLVRSCWRMLGNATIRDRVAEVEQKGQRFRLAAVDSGQCDVFEYDTRSGAVGLGRWEDYTFAEPVITMLRQTVSRRLAAGESLTFGNLFYAQSGLAPVSLSVDRARDALFVVQGGEQPVLAGLGRQEVAGGVIDGAVWVCEAGRIAGAGLRRIALPGLEIEAEPPAALDLRLDGLSGVLEAASGCVLTIRGADTGRALALVDGRLVAAREKAGSVQIEMPAGRHEFRVERVGIDGVAARLRSALGVLAAGVSAPAEPAAASAAVSGDLEAMWTVDAGAEVVTLASGPDLLLCGTAAGEILRLSQGGQSVWRRALGARVNVVLTKDLDLDGVLDIAAGTSDGLLTVLDSNGVTRWEHRFETTTYPPNVVTIMAADLVGDKGLELIGVSRNRLIDFFDAGGRKLKRFTMHFPCLGATVDLDGDGKEEFVVSRGDMTIRDYGLQVRSRYVGGFVTCAASGDVDGDGKEEMLVGTDWPNAVLLADHSEVLWETPLGATASAALMADLDGDGADEAVVGSEIGIVRVLNATGAERWRTFLGSGVKLVRVCAGPGGTPLIAVATQDRRVHLLGSDGERRGTIRCAHVASSLVAAGAGRLGVAAGSEVGCYEVRPAGH